MNAQEQRDKLKEIYKEHYKSIRASKEKLASLEPKRRILEALNDMKNSAFMEDVDNMIDKVRESAYKAEAKIEQALDEQFENELEEERQQIIKKQQAKSMVEELKAQMGDVYNENEAKAKDMRTNKTIGKKDN